MTPWDPTILQLGDLARIGVGGGLAGFILWAMWRRILRWGPDVDALIQEKDERIAGLIEERDTIKKRADALTNVVEQAVEVAVRLAASR